MPITREGSCFAGRPLPNTRVQRTRSSASPPHSPLTRQPLGATRRRQIAFSMLWLLAIGASPMPIGDIGGGPPPTFEQRFSESKIVALARIEAGATGSFSSQVYRARVTLPFKGSEMNGVLYFWGGNVGSTAYGVGEVYLLMLRNAWKPVADVLAAFAPADAPLHEAVCLNGPILLWRSTASPPPPPLFPTDQSVFLFGCPEPPESVHARPLGQSAVLFHSWVPHDEMVNYLKKLVSASEVRSRAGA